MLCDKLPLTSMTVVELASCSAAVRLSHNMKLKNNVWEISDICSSDLGCWSCSDLLLVRSQLPLTVGAVKHLIGPWEHFCWTASRRKCATVIAVVEENLRVPPENLTDGRHARTWTASSAAEFKRRNEMYGPFRTFSFRLPACKTVPGWFPAASSGSNHRWTSTSWTLQSEIYSF